MFKSVKKLSGLVPPTKVSTVKGGVGVSQLGPLKKNLSSLTAGGTKKGAAGALPNPAVLPPPAAAAKKGAAGAGAAGAGAAGSAARGTDDVAAAATKKKTNAYAKALKNKGKLAKGAAVVGGLAYASYESVKTWIEKTEEVEELVAECLLSCLPQHPNIEMPEAPPICLSEENYNNEALKDWYFPSKNLLNGPDCEENSTLCKKPRDCTSNDVRSICKPNSLETFNRCAEDCNAQCRRCIPNPTALAAVVSTAVKSTGTVTDGVGEVLGSVAGALGIDPTMILAIGIFLIFFLLLK